MCPGDGGGRRRWRRRCGCTWLGTAAASRSAQWDGLEAARPGLPVMFAAPSRHARARVHPTTAATICEATDAAASHNRQQIGAGVGFPARSRSRYTPARGFVAASSPTDGAAGILLEKRRRTRCEWSEVQLDVDAGCRRTPTGPPLAMAPVARLSAGL